MTRLVRSVRTLLAALALAPAASATTFWANANATTEAFSASAGLGLLNLPFPLNGTFGVEGGAERPFSGPDVFSVGVTIRDIDVPLADVDFFVGAGVTLRPEQTVTSLRPFVEGGLFAPLAGPVGLRLGVRGYPQGQTLRVGAGLEVRF